MWRLVAHGLALAPFAVLVISAWREKLGADPQEVLLHELGIYSLWFLLATLAVTPVRVMFRYPIIIRYRRMLGLYFFFYLSCHFLVYCWFFLGWDFRWLAEEVAERPYITLGLLAWLLAIPLAITSNRIMQVKLGRRWKSLHQLVYVIAVLGISHFIWQSKADLNRPLTYLLILLLLLAIRVWSKYRQNSPKKALN